MLLFFSALAQVEKENETKRGVWESSAVLSPNWAFNITLYMTQYIAYTTYTITMDTEEGKILHHHKSGLTV